MKQNAFFLSFFLAFLLFVSPVSAQAPTCEPIYGGGPTCIVSGNLVVDKKIKHPVNASQFVDQLKSSDPRFRPDQQVLFNIDVKNTSNTTQKNITVSDIFPPQFLLYADTIGEFDNETLVFTYTIAELKAGETKRIALKAKTAKADEFRPNEIVCLINQVEVFTDRTKSNPSLDISRFCVERTAIQPTPTPIPASSRNGLPVAPPPPSKTSPKTGPEALALIALVPSALAGFFLRRKTKHIH